jgi:hypothetical protein
MSKRRLAVMNSAIGVMYVCATIRWAIALSNFVRLVHDPVAAKLGGPSLSIASILVFCVSIVISDLIVLWRAHVLWGFNRIILGISAVLVMFTIAGVIVTAVTVAQAATQPKNVPINAAHNIYGALGVLSSVLTNLWATILVTWKTWTYRKNIINVLRQYRETSTERVLVLLVESGAFFTMIWALAFISNMLGIKNTTAAQQQSESEFFRTMMFAAMPMIVGMYPTGIIVVVCMQKTLDGSKTLFTLQMPEIPSQSRFGSDSGNLGTSGSQVGQNRPVAVDLAYTVTSETGREWDTSGVHKEYP